MAQKIGCDLDFNNNTRGINALDPVNPQDYATKNYVDNVSPTRSYSFLAARNANISSDQALRRQNGTFINNNPYIVPYDSVIYAVTAENSPTDITDTWDLEVEVNSVVVFSITVPGTDHKIIDNTLNIAVSEGDEIVIFFRNASGTVVRPGGAVYLREPVLSGPRPYNFTAARNASISSNQALRRQNGTFISNCPYIIPFDSAIYAVTAENNPNDVSDTWDLEIEINGIIVLTLSVPGTDHKVVNNAINIPVSEGDELVIFFRNASASINNPGGVVYLIET